MAGGTEMRSAVRRWRIAPPCWRAAAAARHGVMAGGMRRLIGAHRCVKMACGWRASARRASASLSAWRASRGGGSGVKKSRRQWRRGGMGGASGIGMAALGAHRAPAIGGQRTRRRDAASRANQCVGAHRARSGGINIGIKRKRIWRIVSITRMAGSGARSGSNLARHEPLRIEQRKAAWRQHQGMKAAEYRRRQRCVSVNRRRARRRGIARRRSRAA